MRLRWITVLCALLLKVALIGAMLLLGRMVLQKNYLTLEREHAEADLSHVCCDTSCRNWTLRRSITLPGMPHTGICAMQTASMSGPKYRRWIFAPVRGALVRVRDLGPTQVAELSRLADVPISFSGTSEESAEISSSPQFSHGDISTVTLNEDRLASTFAVAMVERSSW